MNKKAEKRVKPGKRERRSVMATLATPKGSSYVVKSNEANKVISYKPTAAQIAKIKARAKEFEQNNLKKK